MSTRKTSLARLWQIRHVIRKHGLADLLKELSLSKKAQLGLTLLFGKGQPSDESRGVRIRRALEELGPVFVKLGQALSTRPDLLPLDISLELTKLQDQVPPFAEDQALDIIRQCYGEDFDTIFASVEQTAMASASVAQVHAATLNDGLAIEGKNGKHTHEVIVKVLRPGITEVIESDLSVMYLFAGLLQKHWSRGDQFKPVEVIKEYDHTIHDELDLRQEAANCTQMGDNFIDSDVIYVPKVYWEYTHTNVMVMERIYGTSIREIDTLKSLGHSLEELGKDGVHVFFKQAFEDNFFHADMHAGNIFVSDQGKWIAIDFGIMGTLTDQDKHYLAAILIGFFNRDYRAIANVHMQAGWINEGTRLAEFESAMRLVCEPIFAKPLSEISFGTVLMQVFQTVRRFEMPVQPQLVLLYKTLLNIEGLGRQLYPELNLWDTAKPYLEDWMKKQLSPQTLFEEFKRDWPQWKMLLPELPALIKERLQHQTQQQATVQNEPPKKNILWLSITILSLAVVLLSQQQLIPQSAFTNSAPWLAMTAALIAYFQRR